MKKTDFLSQDTVEHVEFEALQDEDLQSVTGGCSVTSNVSNACCGGDEPHVDGYDG